MEWWRRTRAAAAGGGGLLLQLALLVGDLVGVGGDLGEPQPGEQRLHGTTASVSISWTIASAVLSSAQESIVYYSTMMRREYSFIVIIVQ